MGIASSVALRAWPGWLAGPFPMKLGTAMGGEISTAVSGVATSAFTSLRPAAAP